MNQKRKYERWDIKNNLKGVTIYLEPSDKKLLKKIARDIADTSVHRYIRRLVEADIRKHFPKDS